MNQVIQAIYANGVFRPLQNLDLPENQPCQIIVETSPDTSPIEFGRNADDPLAGLETSTGIRALAENFDDYRLGLRKP